MVKFFRININFHKKRNNDGDYDWDIDDIQVISEVFPETETRNCFINSKR